MKSLLSIAASVASLDLALFTSDPELQSVFVTISIVFFAMAWSYREKHTNYLNITTKKVT